MPGCMRRELIGRQPPQGPPRADRQPVAGEGRRALEIGQRVDQAEGRLLVVHQAARGSMRTSPLITVLPGFAPASVSSAFSASGRSTRCMAGRSSTGRAVLDQAGHDAVQDPHGVFGAFRIAAEPEQIVGRAARQILAGAAQLDDAEPGALGGASPAAPAGRKRSRCPCCRRHIGAPCRGNRWSPRCARGRRA